jgi:formylglycine-generating enzyme required for sulfatase activity/serine/threonine protein kinase
VRFLGRGAMGEVWEAEYLETGEHYALKFLLEEAMTGENALTRFRREAEIMAALDHPHIAKVQDWGEEDGRHWLCVELLGNQVYEEGAAPVTTLEDYISYRGGKLPQEEVQICMGQFLDALAYAHGRGLVHRDLKPANILLCEEGMKIADFGLVDAAGSEWMATKVQATVAATIARGGEATLLETVREGSASAPSSPQRALLGTFAYMSPEQKDGFPATERSDLYAAGLVCFHMLTGNRSLGLEMPSQLDNRIWPGWDAFILKALRSKPEDRYASAAEMSAALGDVSEEVGGASARTAAKRDSSVNRAYKSPAKRSGRVPPSRTQSVPEPGVAASARKGSPAALVVALVVGVVALLGYGTMKWWEGYSNGLDRDRGLVDAPVFDLAKQKREMEEAAAELEAKKAEAEEAARKAQEAAAKIESERKLAEEAALKAASAKQEMKRQKQELEAATEEARKADEARKAEEAAKKLEAARKAQEAAAKIESERKLAEEAAQKAAAAKQAMEKQKQELEAAAEQAQKAEEAAKKLEAARQGQVATATPGKAYIIPGLGLEMIQVPAGEFLMGSPGGLFRGEKNREVDETQHQVRLTQPFWLGKYEVKQGQWKAVMGSNPSQFSGDDLPVEEVSWEDAMAFCRKLNQMDGNRPSGYVYSLPTEAQWEYACRAGTTTATAFGKRLTIQEANFAGYSGKTTPVGSYRPNAWGFYDLHGNVWEWCSDWYGNYPSGSVTDPTGSSSGTYRVRRGGSWPSDGGGCRSADRGRYPPGYRGSYLGFRPSLRSE